MNIHKIIGKFVQPKIGFVLSYHKYTGPYNPVHEQLDEDDQPLPEQEPYNAVDVISMHHDICNRDNNTKKGKHEYDDIVLQELDIMQPREFREKLDRKLTRTIIGKKKLGWGVKRSGYELHRPIRRKFVKRRVIASGTDAIWTADQVDMQSFDKVRLQVHPHDNRCV